MTKIKKSKTVTLTQTVASVVKYFFLMGDIFTSSVCPILYGFKHLFFPPNLKLKIIVLLGYTISVCCSQKKKYPFLNLFHFVVWYS